ncbi:MAG: type II secretion system protein [Thermoanaerobaculia bacterium]|nr:type II secretion system protein [Thermoanaerobaculia bacterium]
MSLRRSHRGFTLLELLIVVAILGIIAALLIPNLLDALQKAKQKRTASNMRNIGAAWMSWLTDHVSAASAGQGGIYAAGSIGTFEPVPCAGLISDLQPSNTFFYMQEVNCLDGWKNTFDFAKNANLSESTVLMICSRGRDDQYESDGSCIQDWNMGSYHVTDYDNDIVWADGYFIYSPGSTSITGNS